MQIIFYGPSAADIRQQQQLYASREHDRLSEVFLAVLKHYEERTYPNTVTFPMTLFPFLENFFELFTQADYVISEKYHSAFIRHNLLISNLTAMSSLRTTDAFLERLRHQPVALAKILTLYSARNETHYDPDLFFSENAPLASLWYYQYFAIHIAGLLRQDVLARAVAHLNYRDSRLLPAQGMMHACYGSTYIDGQKDRDLKQLINSAVRKHQGFQAKLAPDPRKIAVISDLWYPTHSVYRNYAAYVKELRDTYHLTLFHSVTPEEKLDTGMFDEVRRLDMSGREAFFGPLSGNFQLAYFPDIGMTDASIVLSNCRIAPIQICSPGHSVSTWGSLIDYFISGADVEIPDGPERNYSERLVLLPGMGAIHNVPNYRPQGLRKQTSEIIINCPWSSHKMCAPFLATIKKLLACARRPVRLRIFPNDGVRMHNGYIPFLADLEASLSVSAPIEVMPGLGYDAYMAAMEEGDLTLDSFHFAGCNSVADSLFLRLPTLVWEGDKWYNRIGPAMLGLIGMEECICTSEEEYLNKALTLIHDDGKRREMRARLKAADLDLTIFSTGHAGSFNRAMGYLIANHAHLLTQGKSPIVVT